LLGDVEGLPINVVGLIEPGIDKLGLKLGTDVGSSTVTDGILMGPVVVEMGAELGLSAVVVVGTADDVDGRTVATRLGDDRGLFVAVGI
jgi:hypothetical protein